MKTAWLGGGTGFIGHQMARLLKSKGYWVRVVDIKPYEYGENDFADEVVIEDLRDVKRVQRSLELNESRIYAYYPKPFEKISQFDLVLNFACQMGGAGYVFTGDNDSDIMHDSALINLNILNCLSKQEFKGTVFYSSSACIYPEEIQSEFSNNSLKETDAYPANPDSEYGWEKLFSERLYQSYSRNKGLDIRIARFHNIFGPEGTYKGGREKAPAALCRKVIESNGEIEIWGTGEQTRSFLYIDECIEGVWRLINSSYREPLNIGSDESVSINELARMISSLNEKKIDIININGPTGVNGRNSNNELIEKVLNWKPTMTLKEGIEKTYKWIENEINK